MFKGKCVCQNTKILGCCESSWTMLHSTDLRKHLCLAKVTSNHFNMFPNKNENNHEKNNLSLSYCNTHSNHSISPKHRNQCFFKILHSWKKTVMHNIVQTFGNTKLQKLYSVQMSKGLLYILERSSTPRTTTITLLLKLYFFQTQADGGVEFTLKLQQQWQCRSPSLRSPSEWFDEW